MPLLVTHLKKNTCFLDFNTKNMESGANKESDLTLWIAPTTKEGGRQIPPLLPVRGEVGLNIACSRVVQLVYVYTFRRGCGYALARAHDMRTGRASCS